MPTDIFLSHISEERGLAIQLKTSLQALFSEDVNVFTSSDLDSIVSGNNWISAVQEALQKAKAVVVLCSKSSIQRSWVQFELGGAWMLGRPIIPLCHAGMKPRELPLPLSLMEGAEIDAEGLQRLFNAIALRIGTRRKADPDALDTHVAALRKADVAGATSMLQFERFIDIVLPAPGKMAAATIPDDTLVESNDESMQLFGFISGPRTWAEIVRAAQRTPDQRWLKELQACIYLASQGQTFRPVQAVWHNQNGSFQPQLSRRDLLPGGACRFHVHLVETVVAPLTEVQNEFGLIATLLRLGLRFRYEVIQKYHRALSAALRAKSGNSQAAADLRGHIRNAISVIENDALSRGAENIDRAAVAELFDRDEDQDAIAQVQDDWEQSRLALFTDDPAPGLEAMRDIIGAMRDLNYRFMSLSTRRFNEMVSERWRPVGPAH